jgi:NAD(P)H-hydrate epimerase
MERAASGLFEWITHNFDKGTPVVIFAGPGNNGGDGLALARMMSEARYDTVLCYVNFTGKTTRDWQINMERLEKTGANIINAKSVSELPVISYENLVVDAIFGTGLTRKLEGFPSEAVRYINQSDARVIALDCPSGLFSEDNTDNDPDSIIRADITLTLQFPKISFYMADNYIYTGDCFTVPIGLHPRALREKSTSHFALESSVIKPLLKIIGKFDHKGNNGHGLIVAGSCGKIGASVLASRAALRTGLGLLTVHIPGTASDIIHGAIPEAMVQCDQSDILISSIYDIDKYNAVGVGPGLGTKPNTVKAIRELLENYRGPLVVDADAINIISQNKELLKHLPQNTILTPHPGEFDRLAGKSGSSYGRLTKQQEFACETGCIIILKGANTSIVFPDGRTWFNTTGNPGMATAGSGDVLTGMVLSLLAQGYSPSDAALISVYVHGYAGDLASEMIGYESLIASDIINNIGLAFKSIRKDKHNEKN